MDESVDIARVLAGEREAFHVLLQRHTAPLLATLRAALPNREDAREVLQETWLRAYENLPSLREPARLRAWLLSIALNLARARRRRPTEAPLDGGEERQPGTEDEGPERLGLEEERAFLRKRLLALPPRQREVLDMRVNHELSHAEIGNLLGITEAASRASYYQGLKRLKEDLGAAEDRA